MTRRPAPFSAASRVRALGATRTVLEWAARTGVKAETIIERLRRGWGGERAVGTPTRRQVRS